MGKVKPYSRRQLARRRREWAKRNTRILVVFVLSALVLLGAETALLTLFLRGSPSLKWYLLGVLHAAVVGGSIHLFNAAFFAHDREAILQLRGAWGEENTRSELERAKRKRLIWGWVDSVTLAAGDIDHLVVTRSGGLVAIDSKWRSAADATDQAAMARNAQKMKLRAEGVVRSLVTGQSGGHRARTNPLPVTPIVVVWGAVQRRVPLDASVEGIAFVGGRQLIAWLEKRSGDPVAKEAAADLLRRVEGFRATALKVGSR